jgi:hypothetical protein
MNLNFSFNKPGENRHRAHVDSDPLDVSMESLIFHSIARTDDDDQTSVPDSGIADFGPPDPVF